MSPTSMQEIQQQKQGHQRLLTNKSHRIYNRMPVCMLEPVFKCFLCFRRHSDTLPVNILASLLTKWSHSLFFFACGSDSVDLFVVVVTIFDWYSSYSIFGYTLFESPSGMHVCSVLIWAGSPRCYLRAATPALRNLAMPAAVFVNFVA